MTTSARSRLQEHRRSRTITTIPLTKRSVVKSEVTMARSRSGTVLEDDIESSIGRSSEEELGEMDAFLDQKQPWSSSVREVRNFDSEECPLCLRIGWRTTLSFWRLKDKHAATPCTHTKIDVQEYLRKTSTTPKARLRRRRCRLLTTFILVVFATLYVHSPL